VAFHNIARRIELPFVTKEWMEKEYTNKSIKQIAQLLGTSGSWVHARLKRFAIKRRPSGFKGRQHTKKAKQQMSKASKRYWNGKKK